MALVGSAVRGVLEWLMMVLIIHPGTAGRLLRVPLADCGETVEGRIEIRADNGSPWGSWGPASYCPNGTHVFAYGIKVQGGQADGDDTALNGIMLHCGTPATTRNISLITSLFQKWGEWKATMDCQGKFMVGFSLRVEKRQGQGDDTAANNLAMICQNGEELYHPNGGNWGSYGSWSRCPSGYAICGLKTAVAPNQGGGDDTALNTVVMYCCKL